MLKKILCRADGTETMGLGHLYRSLAIAEFYKSDYEVSFIVSYETDTSVIPDFYSRTIIPQNVSIEDEPVWIMNNYEPADYLIIADGYQFDSHYQKNLKKFGFNLIYVDDLTTEYMYADVVVNHSPHCQIEDFESEEYTEFALGTKYAILRSGFNRAAKQERSIDKIENVFICFGGSDQYNLSLFMVNMLIDFHEITSIHVVVGASYKHEKLFTIANENERVHVYKNLGEEELCEIMQSCQLAIVPSSTILYEICSVGMPVISGYYVDNQKYIYKEFAKLGLIVDIGDMREIDSENLKRKVYEVLNDSDNQRFVARQKKHFDGDSKRRFLALMNNLNVSFRKANLDDMMMVYDWSNDPVVRKNSYQSASIELSRHKEWFEKKIQDEKVLFLVAMVNDLPAGIVRYEVKDDHSVVGVLVSADFRGQGLASGFLRKSAIKYFSQFSQPILAYIKKENIASVKGFEKAGYILLESTMIDGYDSFIYKKEN